MRDTKKRHAIPNGIILPGTKNAKRLCFDEKAFDGYLWKEGSEIWITDITSKIPGQGNFKKLVDYLNDLGYTVLVPTPINEMPVILEHLGFDRSMLEWAASENPPTVRAPRSGNIWNRHKMGLIRRNMKIKEGSPVEVWSRKPKPSDEKQ